MNLETPNSPIKIAVVPGRFATKPVVAEVALGAKMEITAFRLDLKLRESENPLCEPPRFSSLIFLSEAHALRSLNLRFFLASLTSCFSRSTSSELFETLTASFAMSFFPVLPDVRHDVSYPERESLSNVFKMYVMFPSTAQVQNRREAKARVKHLRSSKSGTESRSINDQGLSLCVSLRRTRYFFLAAAAAATIAVVVAVVGVVVVAVITIVS